ncbi:hypothetical protein ACFO25_10395 [Paenactinomyces guangxiensis]|uniref:Uncharacterized protein n=1 Tax=Paenactinomyces guangxiensis TaxID=1490290 RepID=A0A7W1WUS9_9BACL|nr:hypothetical protein [Paenactinomyces guangxiensis]MBA4496446.1 hypothetical protein [Paenactinomyces guangxiensis]MBH8593562.1 hypothetical protein [Paenactinomyces guangxiensis]
MNLRSWVLYQEAAPSPYSDEGKARVFLSVVCFPPSFGTPLDKMLLVTKCSKPPPF